MHSGEFKQVRTVPDRPEPLEAAGKFAFVCERGLFWGMDQPFTEHWVYLSNAKSFRSDNLTRFSEEKSRTNRRFAKMLVALVGGDHKYIERYFDITVMDNANLQLAPRRKSMRKFIGGIRMEKAPEQAAIHISLASGETIALQLSGFATYEDLTAEGCTDTLKLQPAACGLLYHD